MKFNLMRAKILATIKANEPISVTDLSKKVNISSGTTIYRYLEELKKKNLITMKKEEKKRGRPTLIKTTSKASPISIKAIQGFEKLLE